LLTYNFVRFAVFATFAYPETEGRPEIVGLDYTDLKIEGRLFSGGESCSDPGKHGNHGKMHISAHQKPEGGLTMNHTDSKAGKGLLSDPREPKEVTEAWSAHVWDGFPRELWNGSRFSKWEQVETKERYLSFVREQHRSLEPCHTSINIGLGPVLGPRYAYPWISKLLFELDDPLERNYSNMRRFYSYLKLKHWARPRVYFSGNRSFHIYIDFPPLYLREPVEAPRALAKRLEKELGLTCLDYNVFSERHLSRVPYSLHEKTVRFCVPVSPFWGLNEILKESSRPQRFEPIKISFNHSIMRELKEVDAELAGKPRDDQKKGQTATGWIEKLLRHPLGDGRHRVLWHILTPYLINVKGLPIDRAEAILDEYFLRCGEVRPLQPSAYSFKHLIRYHLRLAERDGYPPWRLETIERLDPQLFLILRETGVVEDKRSIERKG